MTSGIFTELSSVSGICEFHIRSDFEDELRNHGLKVALDESSTQTKQQEFTCAETDSTPLHSVSTQTASLAELSELNLTSVDNFALEHFVQTVEPLMILELRKPSDAVRRAMGSWMRWCESQRSGQNAGSSDATIECIHRIGRSVNLDDRIADVLDWNCNGSVIVVGRGHVDHSSWCEHIDASIGVLKLAGKRSSSATDHSEWVFENSFSISNCVTALRCHPDSPSIAAAGLFTGELVIWNWGNLEDSAISIVEGTSPDSNNQTKANDVEIARSLIDELFHNEPIVSLQWLRAVKQVRQFQLVSASSDGKILVWCTSASNQLFPHLDFPSTGVLLRPISSPHSTWSISNRFPVVGCTSVDVSCFTLGQYVAGTEGGAIQRGSLPACQEEGEDNRPDLPNRISISAAAAALLHGAPGEHRSTIERLVVNSANLLGKNRVSICDVFNARPSPTQLFGDGGSRIFAYDAHAGPVYSVRYSHFHRNLFLTCSIDGSLHIHHIGLSQPILSIEPSSSSYLLHAEWSPSRPLVIAAADNIGLLHIFDILKSTQGPILTIQTNEEGFAIRSLRFIPQRPSDFIALSVSNGVVAIWKLSPTLSNMQPDEMMTCNQMGDVKIEE